MTNSKREKLTEDQEKKKKAGRRGPTGKMLLERP